MAIRTIKVRKKVMARNDEPAATVRERLRENGVTALNLVSSPGAGKTLLLERTLAELGEELRIAVVAGDVQTHNDASRLEGLTDRLVQAVVTGGACHMDARQVSTALDASDLDRAIGYLREVNPEQQLFLTSALSGEGLDEWYAYLRSKVGAGIGG